MLEWLMYCLKIWPALQAGLEITLRLFFMTIVFSIPLGLIVAILGLSKFPGLKFIVSIYVWVLRGTPLLLQLFFVYYGLPSLGTTLGIPFLNIKLDRFDAAVITFILNYSAYFSEIFRAGILSIDLGQHEAARASGMTGGKIMQRIIIPQTIRRVIPPIANETITSIKDTALVASIGVLDLLQATKGAVNRDVNTSPFFMAAIIYLLLTLVLTYLFKFLENKYSKHEVR